MKLVELKVFGRKGSAEASGERLGSHILAALKIRI